MGKCKRGAAALAARCRAGPVRLAGGSTPHLHAAVCICHSAAWAACRAVPPGGPIASFWHEARASELTLCTKKISSSSCSSGGARAASFPTR